MDASKTKDAPGHISCMTFGALAVIGAGLAIWASLMEPGGHFTATTAAAIYTLLAATLLAPVGLAFGIRGLIAGFKQRGTLMTPPSLIGTSANGMSFAFGAYVWARIFWVS